MFTARILIILHPPVTALAAAETIARACEASARPAGLRFALPHTMNGFLPELPQGVTPLFYDAAQGLEGILPCLTDETHFLSLTGPHAFSPRWDAGLYAAWRRFGKRTLFTSSLTPSPASSGSASATEGATIRVPKTSGNRLATLRQLTPALQKRFIPAAENEPHGILPHLRRQSIVPAAFSQPHPPALSSAQADAAEESAGGWQHRHRTGACRGLRHGACENACDRSSLPVWPCHFSDGGRAAGSGIAFAERLHNRLFRHGFAGGICMAAAKPSAMRAASSRRCAARYNAGAF